MYHAAFAPALGTRSVLRVTELKSTPDRSSLERTGSDASLATALSSDSIAAGSVKKKHSTRGARVEVTSKRRKKQRPRTAEELLVCRIAQHRYRANAKVRLAELREQAEKVPRLQQLLEIANRDLAVARIRNDELALENRLLRGAESASSQPELCVRVPESELPLSYDALLQEFHPPKTVADFLSSRPTSPHPFATVAPLVA